jgi:cell division protein ZipA
MQELRWVLLGLGLLVIIGVYLWGRGYLSAPTSSSLVRRARTEPSFEADTESSEDETPAEDTPRRGYKTKVIKRPPSARAPDKVVTLRMVPRDTASENSIEAAVLAMRKLGLEHGEYGIFHRYAKDTESRPTLFSVANLTEPGSFDLTKLSEEQFAGLSLFVVLPSECDPVESFDAMLETARALTHELDAELFDEKGSSWSIQRERFVREEMIQYRHHLEHG